MWTEINYSKQEKLKSFIRLREALPTDLDLWPCKHQKLKTFVTQPNLILIK